MLRLLGIFRLLFINIYLMRERNINTVCVKRFFKLFAKLTFNPPLFTVFSFANYTKHNVRCA